MKCHCIILLCCTVTRRIMKLFWTKFLYQTKFHSHVKLRKKNTIIASNIEFFGKLRTYCDSGTESFSESFSEAFGESFGEPSKIVLIWNISPLWIENNNYTLWIGEMVNGIFGQLGNPIIRAIIEYFYQLNSHGSDRIWETAAPVDGDLSIRNKNIKRKAKWSGKSYNCAS